MSAHATSLNGPPGGKPLCRWGDGKEAVAGGECWTHYQRRRRERPVEDSFYQLSSLQRDALAEIRTAYRQVRQLEAEDKQALTVVRRTAVLAYADGLSSEQIAELVYWHWTAVHDWIPAGLRRPRGSAGRGRAAPEEKITQWRPLLQPKANRKHALADRVRDAREQLVDLIRAATADTNPERLSTRQIGDALEVAGTTVYQWVHGRTPAAGQRPAPQRCVGRRPDGGRCRANARVGKRTCWPHRRQEPGDG